LRPSHCFVPASCFATVPDNWLVSDTCLSPKSLERLSDFRLPRGTSRRSRDPGCRLGSASAAHSLNSEGSSSQGDGFQISGLVWWEAAQRTGRATNHGWAPSGSPNGEASGRSSAHTLVSISTRDLRSRRGDGRQRELPFYHPLAREGVAVTKFPDRLQAGLISEPLVKLASGGTCAC
jgi:hypothetical protein